MSEPKLVQAGQVFRHFKKGNLYLVLAIAEAVGSICREPVIEDDPDDEVVVYVPMSGGIHARLLSDYDGLGTIVFQATYTGSPRPNGLGASEKLVVYVGLYDNPHGNRPCVRPISEWTEEVKGRVTEPGSHGEGMDAMVPRYTRVS